MHLVIDAREIGNPQRTGKGLWTEHVVRALIAKGVSLLLLTDASFPEGFPRPPHVDIRRLRFSGLRWHLEAWGLMRRLPDAVYLSPTSFIVPFLIGEQAATAIVVHDMIAFRNEPHDRKATIIERLTLKRAALSARWIFVLSEATKRDLLARYPEIAPSRVTVVYAGPVHPADAASPKSSAGAILCPGTLCPRKNQLRLLQAYAQLPEELRSKHPLLLAGGRGWHDDEILAVAHATPNVHRLGYVSDEEMDLLYGEAAVLALPSLYEGFGLPVLSALQRGIPVLTSNRGSLPEVAGNAAVMVNPEDVSAIRSALLRLLTDDGLRSDLRQKGQEQAKRFSWEKTADLILAALR